MNVTESGIIILDQWPDRERFKLVISCKIGNDCAVVQSILSYITNKLVQISRII